MEVRGTSRAAAFAVLTVLAALAAAQPAQAVTGPYTLRVSRTQPQPLWVGLTPPSGYVIGVPIALVPSVGPTGNAEWMLSPADTEGGRAYHLINRYSNKCMDVQGPSKLNGANVHQWNCHSGASQAWRLVRPPIGRGIGHQLINVYADKCLDVTGFRNRPDTLLQTWSCSLAWNQDFVLTRVAP